MTYEEAMRRFEPMTMYCDGEETSELMDMARKALKKQIPWTPKHTHGFTCFMCGYSFSGKENFCPACGQAINWSKYVTQEK